MLRPLPFLYSSPQASHNFLQNDGFQTPSFPWFSFLGCPLDLGTERGLFNTHDLPLRSSARCQVGASQVEHQRPLRFAALRSAANRRCLRGGGELQQEIQFRPLAQEMADLLLPFTKKNTKTIKPKHNWCN